MPRQFFPHSMQDVLNAVDGPFGLVVGDLPNGSIWVLKRLRKEPGYVLTHFADTTRSRELAVERVPERKEAVNRFAVHIGLGEAI